MPLFLDRHDLVGSQFENATAESILEAHQCDLREQEQFGVNYLTYWWHQGAKTAFCLVEAPNPEAALEVHQRAHGDLPTRIIEVDRTAMEGFLGRIRVPRYDDPIQDVAFRTILCMKIEEQAGTNGHSQLGAPKSILRRALDNRGGNEVETGGDSLLASFATAAGAIECALAIQESFAPIASLYQSVPVRVRTGISAGEPVMAHVGLFGKGVEEANLLCDSAHPGEVLVTGGVRDLCLGRGFAFEEISAPDFSDGAYAVVGRLAPDPAFFAPQAVAKDKPDGLTPREVEILQQISAGKTNREIADWLVISRDTVATHVRHILEKTDSANRAEAVSYAVKRGLA